MGHCRVMGSCGSRLTEVDKKLDDHLSKVKIHVGPLEVSDDGVVAKPQFLLGFSGPNLVASAGVRDLRDGVQVGARAQVQQSYAAEGTTLPTVLQSLKAADVEVAVIDEVITLLPNILGDILEELKVDALQAHYKATVVMHVYVGVGVSAGLWFGWVDTNGFR